jgi:Sulfocyanin (SoxE) domain
MSSFLRHLRFPMMLTGALVFGAAACSKKGAEQQPAVESAASGPAGTQSNAVSSGDTMAGRGAAGSTAADTTASTDSNPAPAATPAQAGTTGTGKRTKPPVKPSIDPGRKATPTSVKPAAPAPVDTPSTQSNQGPLKWDAASKTATFQLIGGPSGFQYNGYSSGGATLTLPPNANVVINFINKDGTPHSAEVIPGEGTLPNQAVDAAIPRAYTNQVLQGLPQEGTDVMKFTVPASGTYRIFCGVPGHGLSGMWIWMKIDPAAKQASFGPTKA